MIWESYEWKEAVRRNNAYVRRFSPAALAADEDSLLERVHIRLLTNALLVRRLLETPNVATQLSAEKISIHAYPWSGSHVDYMNCHRIDEKYQLGNPVAKSIAARVLCDQIIHSLVWTWVTTEEGDQLEGFIVGSDRKKHSEIYSVPLVDWLSYTNAVATSHPCHVEGKRNPDTLDWEWVAR